VDNDAPIRALVVDDDPDINRLLQLRLKARGYEVASAADGAAGLAEIDRFAPDLLVCDVSMPLMGGLEVLERVRAEGRDLAVIMATAFGSEKVAIEALRRGADDYLRKPLEPVEFQAVLDRTVGRLKLARDNARLQAQLDEKRRQLEAELARAAEVQARLLPGEPPAVPGWEVAAACLPARDVGGDFYDWRLEGGEALTLTLGDVMGKGMPAALLMATVRAALRAAPADPSPGRRLEGVERALADDLEGAAAFVTLFHARIDLASGAVAVADAGHGLALLRRADGTTEALAAPKGLPMGVLPGSPIGDGAAAIGPGEALVIYSDGLPDARPDLATDAASLAPYLAGRAREMVDRLVALADAGADRPDDLTVVVVRRADA
jgi:phosphoserine phosphatase RsbU/P